MGPAQRIIDQPSHPYTRLLLDTIPTSTWQAARGNP